MGAAFYPVIDRDIPGFEPHLLVNGKALARAIEELDALAKPLGLTPLMEYFSMSEGDLRSVLEDSFDKFYPNGVTPDWFEPAQMLPTVRGLIAHLRRNPDALAPPDWAEDRREATEWVVGDLEDIEQVLQTAQAQGVRVRLSGDC